jgi:hypothetical protein
MLQPAIHQEDADRDQHSTGTKDDADNNLSIETLVNGRNRDRRLCHCRLVRETGGVHVD